MIESIYIKLALSVITPVEQVDVALPLTVSSYYEEAIAPSCINLVKNDILDRYINKINTFKLLPNNWNTYGAEPFSTALTEKAISVLKRLSFFPDIFPTGRNSIQFEYEKDNGDYLEFEIFKDKIEYYLTKNNIENDGLILEENLEPILKDFYA